MAHGIPCRRDDQDSLRHSHERRRALPVPVHGMRAHRRGVGYGEQMATDPEICNSSQPDDRWLVIKGRRWRRTDPALESVVVDELKSHLGAARNAVRTAKKSGSSRDLEDARHRVNAAKRGLGERGDYWWEMDPVQRHKRAEAALQELRSPDQV